MKIALIQQNYKIGDMAGNAARMRAAIAEAAERGAAAVVFSHRALVGNGPLLGLAASEAFERQAAEAESEVAAFAASAGVRLISKDTEIEGIRIHCAADYFRHGGPEEKRERLRGEATATGCPVVWVNAVGAQTGTIYYGGSCVVWPGGEAVELPLFKEEVAVVDLSRPQERSAAWGDRLDQLHGALILGIRDYFAKTGMRDACVAMSGGIDSALVLALAAEALGAERVKTVMLPSRYSSDHSVEDSEEMIRRLGIPTGQVWRIPITATFDAALDALQPILSTATTDASRGLAEENMQARIRLMMTMALSNSHGALMLNTSNKSEAAVGYGTLYGDTSGALGVIGDLYKEDVYALSRRINEAAVARGAAEGPIPEHILTKAPSAELRPGQQDTDSLPDYPLLDAILQRLIEGGRSAAEVVAEGFEREVVERVCRLLLSGDFKRFQLPPALRVSGCTFGVEWQWPIVAAKIL